jgi:type II secretory pathway pseudopilin PulG
MKFSPDIQACPQQRPVAGFTLVEMMFSVVIFLFIFIGVLVSVQIFGLRVYTLGATKLSATAGALKVLNHIRDDIRGAKTVYVGTYTNNTFAQTPGATSLNVGNAVELFLVTDQVPPYTIYYLDSSSNLDMTTTTDGINFTTTLLASYINNANQIVFDAEDFQGNILTNNANNRIIRMELDFYQWEYPIGFVGGVGYNAYDYYKLTTRISRRDID